MIFYDETEERYIRKFFLLLAIYIKLNVRSTLRSETKIFQLICLLRGNSSFDRSSPNTNTAVPSRNQTRKLVIAARPSRKTGLEPRLSINIQRESTIISRELSLESRIQDSSRHRAVHLWNQWLSKSCNFYLFLYFFVCRMLFRFGRRGYLENELDVRWGPWIIT